MIVFEFSGQNYSGNMTLIIFSGGLQTGRPQIKIINMREIPEENKLRTNKILLLILSTSSRVALIL